MADSVDGLRPPGIGTDQPDNSVGIVGREGIPVRQDLDGTQIQRLGVAGADADWGPAEYDITDTERAIATPENVGGTTSSSGIIRSLDGESIRLVYAWTDETDGLDTIQEAEDDTATVVQDFGTDTAFEVRNVTTKSDNCKVFVADESAAGTTNNIEFTLNFH